MKHKISGELHERILDACNGIAQAQGLEPGVCDELYGHFEDKVLGYLNGEEPVSEADAFILANHHFGDQGRVKELLGDVHQAESAAGLARRLAAVAALSCVYAFIPKCLVFLTGGILAMGGAHTPFAAYWGWQGAHLLGGAAALMLMWRVLSRWLSVEREGNLVWYMRWPGYQLALLLTLSLLTIPANNFLGVIAYHWCGPDLLHEYAANAGAWLNVVGIAYLLLGTVIFMSIWLWWCDRPPRSRRSLYYGCFAWALWMWWGSLITTRFHVVSNAGVNDQATAGYIELMNLGDTVLFWRFPLPMHTLVTSLSSGLLQSAVLAAAGVVVYVMSRFVWDAYAARKVADAAR